MKNLSKNNPILATLFSILLLINLCSININAVRLTDDSCNSLLNAQAQTEAAARIERAAIIALAEENQARKNALLIGAVRNKNISNVIELLADGANVNAKNASGRTVLMLAIIEDQNEIIEILLNANADVNIISRSGDSALIFAILQKNVSAARLLLEKRANVNAKNNMGDTALIWAASNIDSEDGLEKTKLLVQLLLDYHADVNIQNNKGHTALIRAVYLATASNLGNSAIVEKLLTANPDLTIVDKLDYTALQRAKINAKVPGYKKTYNLLLTANAR